MSMLVDTAVLAVDPPRDNISQSSAELRGLLLMWLRRLLIRKFTSKVFGKLLDFMNQLLQRICFPQYAGKFVDSLEESRTYEPAK